MVCVTGLHAALVQCYDQWILPHEHGGLSWAAPGQVITINSAACDESELQQVKSADLEENHDVQARPRSHSQYQPAPR
jgi:hypothetical protein